jgi:protein ImuB
VIGDLVADLTRQLLTRGTGARRLDLLFERVDGHVQGVRVDTARPSRDQAHLAKLLTARIEEVEPGLGIEAMTLACPLVEPLAPSQTEGLASQSRQGRDLAALVDALANRFGRDCLYRAIPRESAMPEREVGAIEPLAPPVGAAWDDDLPRPARLLARPERIDVTALLPDHPPRLFVWRGQRHRVVRADGPERLHGEWWRESGTEADAPYTVRDYFEVETLEGGRYWLFRLGDGQHPATGPMQWFVHGAFA